MTGRLARWMDTLRDLDFEVKRRPGTSNGNADGLSHRRGQNRTLPSMDGGC